MVESKQRPVLPRLELHGKLADVNASFYDDFYDRFLKQLAQDYPQTAAQFPIRERLSKNLISPHVTELPRALRTQAEEIVKAYFALRQTQAWQARLKALNPTLENPGNTSVLMSYDFHVDDQGQLRLIEVNTNASLSSVVDISHRVHGIKNVFSENFREEILDCFAQEHREARGADQKLSTIAIVDDKPEQQRLFAEFVLYRELFTSRGWATEFRDPSDLKFIDGKLKSETATIDLVYNRDTDFYFTNPTRSCLNDAMRAKAATITPHPFEYRLLADKERLLELSNDEILNAAEIADEQKALIRRSLIRTIDIHSVAPDYLWKERKKFFFKPRNSHGGKAVYRGSSTSRKTFDEILTKEYLAQDFVPPALIKFENEAEDFKSDLRFYVYRDRIQLACARLYRGQMTNAQTEGGGVSVINWT